jgi:hypothetical protein
LDLIHALFPEEDMREEEEEEEGDEDSQEQEEQEEFEFQEKIMYPSPKVSRDEGDIPIVVQRHDKHPIEILYKQ